MLARMIEIADARMVRYLLASVGALAVDMGCFLGLLSAGMWPTGASMLAYCMGIVAHWLMSSRAVFTDGVASRGAGRTRQKALFVSSALVGLALTAGIVWLGDMAAVDPRIAKMMAIVVSFFATWLLRSRIVFRPSRASCEA